MFQKPKLQEDFCVFTIFDTKTSSYRMPIIVEDDASIIRALSNNMVNPAMEFDQYVQNAEDFQLFKIGSFDKKTGVLVAGSPVHVANLHDLKAMSLQKARALSAT